MPRLPPITRWELQDGHGEETCFWSKVEAWIAENAAKIPAATPASTPDLGVMLEVSKTTIYRWIREGRLPPTKFLLWLAEEWDQDIRDVISPEVPRKRKRTAFEVATAELRRVAPDKFPQVISALRDPRVLDALAALGAKPAARQH